jgi:hypothetical protein
MFEDESEDTDADFLANLDVIAVNKKCFGNDVLSVIHGGNVNKELHDEAVTRYYSGTSTADDVLQTYGEIQD